MKSKQTAVEWFAKRILSYKSPTNLNGTDYVIIPVDKIEYLQSKAKETEKEQISEAYRIGVEEDVYNNPLKTGEQYYNETYGKNNTVREYNSKIIKELIDETKPKEMERINNEMERINKLTVVEWLQEALEHTILTHEQIMQTIGLFEQAKEMEKQQIMDAWKDGSVPDMDFMSYAERYYDETYGE